MRTAEDANADAVEYALGLKELNKDLYTAAALDYQRTRHGVLIQQLKEQRNQLLIGASNYKTAEELDAMAKEDPTALRALLETQLAHLNRAVGDETAIAAAYDACHERMRAMWREWEFANRPENGPDTNGMAPNFNEQERIDE